MHDRHLVAKHFPHRRYQVIMVGQVNHRRLFGQGRQCLEACRRAAVVVVDEQVVGNERQGRRLLQMQFQRGQPERQIESWSRVPSLMLEIGTSLPSARWPSSAIGCTSKSTASFWNARFVSYRESEFDPVYFFSLRACLGTADCFRSEITRNLATPSALAVTERSA